MEDLDRELKKIQLQRERLALEREIALKGAASAVGSVTKEVAQASSNVGRFLALWWKKTLLIAALLAIAAVAINWMLEYNREKKMVAIQAKYADWNAASVVFAAQQCPEHNFQCSASDNARHETCLRKSDFMERNNCLDNFVGCVQAYKTIDRDSCLVIQKMKYQHANPLNVE